MPSAILDVPVEGTVISAIGPAHDPITPAVARSAKDLLDFARRFDASVEVYSPDPWHELMLLAPLLEPGRVALLFAPEGRAHSSAQLSRLGTTLAVKLADDADAGPFRSSPPVRYLVGFVVVEDALPPEYELAATD